MNDEKRLTWVNNNFIAKELYAPFIIEKDIDYYEDLSQKLKLFLTALLKQERMKKV